MARAKAPAEEPRVADTAPEVLFESYPPVINRPSTEQGMPNDSVLMDNVWLCSCSTGDLSDSKHSWRLGAKASWSDSTGLGIGERQQPSARKGRVSDQPCGKSAGLQAPVVTASVAKEDGVKRGSKKARHDDRGAALGLSESVRGDPPREEGKRMLVEMLKGRPVLKEVLDIAPEVASLWLRDEKLQELGLDGLYAVAFALSDPNQSSCLRCGVKSEQLAKSGGRSE